MNNKELLNLDVSLESLKKLNSLLSEGVDLDEAKKTASDLYKDLEAKKAKAEQAAYHVAVAVKYIDEAITKVSQINSELAAATAE